MNKVNLTLSVLLAIAILVSWNIFRSMNQNNSLTMSGEKQITSVKQISPQEFSKLVKNKKAFVVDVHTPEQTHIPDTDAFIPDTEINARASELPADKSTLILVYCRSGNMSARASKDIVALGYTNVYDLKGGTNAYKEQQVSVQLWPDKHDLGTVIYGDVATTSFTLTNYMPLPLKITRVSTSCGCTKASVEKKELKAYESTTVNVSFDPAVHKDDTDLGELSRTIYIETDNPNYSDLEAMITANVIKKN